jgi:hypothetical protein
MSLSLQFLRLRAVEREWVGHKVYKREFRGNVARVQHDSLRDVTAGSHVMLAFCQYLHYEYLVILAIFSPEIYFCTSIFCTVRVIGLDIATGYGLDGRGSIPGRGKIFLFSTASRPA